MISQELTAEDLRTRLIASEKWAFAWMPESRMTVCLGPCSRTFRSMLPAKSVQTVLVGDDRVSLQDLGVPSALCAIEASATRLPFSTGSVDTAILIDALPRVGDERRVVDEVQRVLRPGGKLILTVPNRGMFRFFSQPPSDPDGFTLRRYYSEADLTRLLFLRFKVLRQHYGGLFLYPFVMSGQRSGEKGVRRSWNRLLEKIADFDNDVSWGRWSYKVILLAEKI